MIDVTLVEINNLTMDCFNGITLIIPLKDPITLFYKDRIDKVDKNGMVVINPLEAYMASFCLNAQENLNIIVKIRADYINDVYQNILTTRFINLVANLDDHEMFLRLINDLVKISMLDKKLGKESINKITIEVLRYLADNFIDYEIIRNKKQKMDMVEKAILISDDKIKRSQDISVSELSSDLMVSESSFSINFKEITGLSFSEYKIYAKVYYASNLLAKTSYSIEEISDILNYRSPRSLNDNFVRYLDMTPYVYKKKIDIKETKKSEDLLRDKSFKEFILKYSTIDYNSLYELSELKTSFDIEKRCKLIDNKRRIDVHSMDKFGEDYISGIKKVAENIGINYIQLDMRMTKNKQVLLVDLNKYISLQDLAQLLQLSSDYNIRLGIIMDIEGRSMEDYKGNMELLEKDNGLLEDFIEVIIELQSLTKAESYDWILDITKIFKKGYDIEFLKTYYGLRLDLLDRRFSKEMDYSLYIKGLNFSQLEEILNKDILKKLRRKPENIYYSIKNNYLVDISNPFLLKESRNSYDMEISYSKKIKESLSLKDTNFSICSIETEFNISGYDFLYVDLALSYLYLDNIVNLRKYDFIDYHIISRDSGIIYRTELFDKRGFRSPIFFVTSILSQMEGEIIHMEEGCIVSTNGKDYDVVLYGDLINDYYFANTKKFKNLEIYNRNINLIIEGMKGDYKEETFIINYFYGNSRFILNDFDESIHLTYKEKEYIFDVNRPRKTVRKISLDGKLAEKITMQPFLIKYKKYIAI